MKNFTRKMLMALFLVAVLISMPEVAAGQSFLHPSAGLVVNGDLMQAEGGSDFIDVVYGRAGEVYYNRLNNDSTWEGEVLLGTGTEARIAIDALDMPHVVFTSTGKIAYRKFDGSIWSEVVYIESNNAGTCILPDIAIDGNGVAHITYTDTKGNVGDYTDRPDIMYAVNSSNSFVKTLIFNGYLEFYGGADRYAEYFEKGSLIAVDTDGNYYIITHKFQYQTWMGGNDRQYSIVVTSNLGTGGTSASSSDVYTIHDLENNGSAVYALYKQSTFKASELALSGATINFTNTIDITASSVSSLAVNSTDIAISGKTNTNLFTQFNDLSHVYENIVVKGSIVSTVEVDGVFYAVYTDNGDGKIKIREVAEPLSLTRFELAAQTGPAVIDGQAGTIVLEVANGTDLTALVATFSKTTDVTATEVNSVGQTSTATPNDFSAPVTYVLSDGVASRNWVVTITEAPLICAISTSASPVVGGTASGDGNYIEGSNVSVTADSNDGYVFVHWTEGGIPVSTDGEYTFVAGSDRNLVAVFVEEYTLTIQVEGSGSVEVGGVSYTEAIYVSSGTILSLDAIAGAEYHFTGWSGDLTSVDNPESITMDGDKVITANFAINRYTLTIQVEGSGSVEVDDVVYTDVITLNSGTILSLVAIAGNEYHFTGWSGDLASEDNPESITMDGDKVITANFAINQYTLTIQVEGSGTVEVDAVTYDQIITADSGDDLILEAIAAAGFRFMAWSGDLISEENPTSITMDGNKTVTATFESTSSVNANHDSSFEVFPNPMVDEIQFNNLDGIKRITISTMNGLKVVDVLPNGSKSVDVSALKSGFYIVSIELTSGVVFVKKMMKK